jgi:hypothetical protein
LAEGTVIKVNGNDNLNASPVNHPPSANGDNVGETSPPPIQSNPEPQKNEKKSHRLSRFFKKILKIRFIQTGPPVNITYVNIAVNYIDSHNTPNTNMTFNGPIYNSTFVNQEIHEEKNSAEKHDEKQSEDDDESDEDHHEEYVEFEAVETIANQESNKMDSSSNIFQASIKDYITRCDNPDALVSWLHTEIEKLNRPKDKLKFVRAVYEASYFTKLIPYEVYVGEFGEITRSRYFYWMGEELRYNRDDIDAIIDRFPF